MRSIRGFPSLILLAILFLGVFVFSAVRTNILSRFAPQTGEFQISGNQITVGKGGDLQAAIEKSKPGDTIVLEPGATYKGPFTLPNKQGDDFITVTISKADSIPPAGFRIDPSRNSSLPILATSVKGEPVLKALAGAHNFRFIGIEFQASVEGLANIIQIGTGEETKLEDLPHHLEFDRVYVHGDPVLGQRRGIAANGRFIKIVNSYISDIKRHGEESQAIAVWATDGPIEITNNYLEAAGEGILFGGATSFLGLTPTNCLVKSNNVNKQISWRKEGWVVKNLFEIKHGRKIRVEGNLFSNNWEDGQDGSAILFTTREDSGKNVLVEDIEFENNIVRGAGGAINLYGAEGKGGRRLTIRNNFFLDIDGGKWGGNGFFLKATSWDGLTIDNNIVLQSGNITTAYGGPITNLLFRNNVIPQNEYGFFGNEAGIGKPALNRYFPSSVISGNLFIGGSSRDMPSNTFVPSLSELRFVDAFKGDYRLNQTSKLLRKGLDGAEVGPQIDPQTIGGR